MSNEVFDFKKALEDLKSGKPLSGKDGILTPLVKKLTEAALEAELDYHLNNNSEEESNRRNGKSSKMMKSTSAHFHLKLISFCMKTKCLDFMSSQNDPL